MFEIQTPTEARLTTFNVRTELLGEDPVLAFSMTLKITTGNTFLDAISPTVREALYKAVPDQEQLPGVEPVTPLLRCKLLDSVPLTPCFEGWTLFVDYGMDEGDPIAIGGAKVDKFRVAPKEGGTVELSFRVGSNDIDEEELGHLAGKLGQSIVITMKAPEAPAPVIDGTVAAFEADHPDATDLFAAGREGEAEAGDADAPADHAELEAGMQQAIQSAGVSRKPIKYRDAATGATWSGRGLKPKWLVVTLQSGRSISEFQVSA